MLTLLVTQVPEVRAADAEAEDVLSRFLNAQAYGDVDTVAALMGGPLLEKRSRLLANPNFSRHLQETYAGARFTIQGSMSTGPAEVIFDVSIITHPDETWQRRYVLRREQDGTFKVHGESEL